MDSVIISVATVYRRRCYMLAAGVAGLKKGTFLTYRGDKSRERYRI